MQKVNSTCGVFILGLPRLAIGIVLVLGMIIVTAMTPAGAAWEPPKKVTIIVAAGPGGGFDQFVRAITKSAEAVSGVKFVVENHGGGGGATGTTHYMGLKGATNGTAYLGVYPQIFLKMLKKTMPFPTNSLVPVMRGQNGPAALIGQGGEKRFKNYAELIAYMKKGNEIKVATLQLTGFDDLTLKVIENKEGVTFKRVPIQKPGQRFAALMGGHVDLMTQRLGETMKFINAGKMKPIIADLPARIKQLPDLPTFNEKKMTFGMGFWRAIAAKKGTPPEAIKWMNDLLHKAMQHKDYMAYEHRTFYDLTPGYLDRHDFAKSLKIEIDFYGRAYVKGYKKN